jgi:hypothetical protein
MITKGDDGSYEVDAIPGLGGPFETAAEYFEAWSKHAKFPFKDTYVWSLLPTDIQDEIVASIRDFPQRLTDTFRNLNSTGSFPLCHPDFRHSNIIIDGNYNILSVIDWENAGTVPWEAVEFPLILATVPPPMDAPWNYDEGIPIDEETRKLWDERTSYIQCVKEAEEEKDSDHNLSTVLASRDLQNIATALRLYVVDGKMGYYCRILDQFDQTPRQILN